MKRIFTILLCVSVATGILHAQDRKNDKMNRFIDQLMSQMTLEEKIGQLNLPSAGDITTGQATSSNIADKIRQGQVGGLFNIKGVAKIRDVQRIATEESRLKIPLLFGMDVIHGYETAFPIPLGLSATWNMEAIEQSARIAAIEASADGICWTFSPMVDISQDARWGRVSEGSGEDPFLGGEIAKAMIRGYQGDNSYSSNSHIMACVKHYALYGAGFAGRDYNTVDMSRIRMFNEYMYPYKAAVEAGVGSVMASFNEVDGVPATANRWLMTDVLRNQWKFDGFVVTDYTGINEMVEHGIGDLPTVSARALKAGIDMDMVGEGFLTTLARSLKEKKVSTQEIDRACRRILEAKYKLGLFDDPYKFCDLNRPAKEIYTQAHRNTARKIAAESFVLLKNQQELLPLKKSGKIAVIGPLANTRSNMPGTWSVAVDLTQPTTLVEGIQEVAGKNARVLYAKGSNLTADAELEKRATMFGRELGRDGRSDKELLNEALKVACQSDVIVAALGESSEMSGEASSRTDLNLPDVQKELLAELAKTGKPVVLVVFTGRPLTLTWEEKQIPAILNVWFGGTEAAPAIADVLFGDVNPSGKLTMSFPQHVGQSPLFYNHKNTGRPLGEGRWFEKFRSNYLDVSNDPLYPFGFGLSYTNFAYSPIRISDAPLRMNGILTATVTLTNNGKRDGQETVQLYIRDVVGSVTRPVKELKGFQKVFLKAGESKEISFRITPELLKFYNYDLDYVCEPGEFHVMIGGNSRDTQLATFTLLEEEKISDEALLDSVQRRTFNYFWNGAEPVSGMARERLNMDGNYPLNDKHIITSGGSGFGIMAIIAGIDRQYVTREEGLERMEKMVSFLERADTFHGAFPHWWDGETGKVKAFSTKDNGGDLVETAFLIQGLLAAHQYYVKGSKEEQKLAARIDKIWRKVDWNWYRNKENVLFWHWSPKYNWDMNFRVRGFNECLIMYILAAASPTHGVPAKVYHEGWAEKGAIAKAHSVEGLPLSLNYQTEGAGPLFWAHYSFLGLDPNGLTDSYTNYFEEMRNYTLANRTYCIRNPKNFKGYGKDCWGLTASYSVEGYAAHAPKESEDHGVISPTAALSSIVYTPGESMDVMKYLYQRREKVEGPYGFYDAFSETADWYPQQYLAIDQGPIAVMIENYRSQLLWKLFMQHPDIQKGLRKLGFSSPHFEKRK